MVAIFARSGALALSVFCALPSLSCARSTDESVQMSQPTHGAVLSVEDAMGVWRLTSVDPKITCVIALSRFASGDGFGVHVEACSAPAFAAATLWRPTDGGFELVDTDGTIISRFRQSNVDAFVSLDGVYDLRRAAFS